MTHFIVFIDVETTGLSVSRDEIIQLSAIRFFGNNETARFDTYINPGRTIPAASIEINKITDDMVSGAPTINDVRSRFLEFIEGAFLVGYNVSFDLNFINTALDGALVGIEYFDVMSLARKLLDLPDYKLETVAEYLGFHPEYGFHNSLTDCEATADVFWKLSAQVLLNDSRIFLPRKFQSKKKSHSFSPKEIVPSATPTDSSHPLYGKKIVFTGELSIGRHEAAQLAVDVGASVKSGVSGKTNYLVVGTQDPTIIGASGMSGKEEKARELNALGKASIEIISECEFISLLEGVVQHG